MRALARRAAVAVVEGQRLERTLAQVGGKLDEKGRRSVEAMAQSVPVALADSTALPEIGGEAGWYYGNWLWRIRGLLDRLVGGVGLRRGRRDPATLRPGDTVDFWRVEAVEDPTLLRLQAEMRLPGRAWLQFEVNAAPEGAIIRQTAIFDPHGLAGVIYWYALYPIHQFVFAGMIRNIAAAARAQVPARDLASAP